MVTLAWAGCSSGSGTKTNPDARHGDGGGDTAEGGAAGTSGNGGASDGGDAQAGAVGADADAASTGDAADVAQEAAPSGDAQDGPAGDTTGDTAADAAAEAASDAPAEGGVAGPLVVNAPSFSVADGAESTQCVVLDLGNADAIHVGEIKATLSTVVYELRIGAVSGTAQTTPTPCMPFGDLNDATVTPLVFARNRTEDFSFPAGVGYTLAAHQLLRFEIHVWNSGSAGTLSAAVSATFTPMPAASFQHEAGLLMVEAADINIQAHASNVDSGRVFFPLSTPLGSASITRLQGYTHLLGVDAFFSTAANASDQAPVTIYAPVYDSSSPPVVYKTPAVTVPASGGIDIECIWNNSMGNGTVMRGTSVRDERCAAVISYYPAVAAHSCFHTSIGGGVDFCCPGGGGCQ
jgi:hypothetical protein